MIVGGGSEIMASCGWLWVMGVKLWLVVGGGSELMPVCGWSWEMAANYGWSRMVARFSNTPTFHRFLDTF